MPKNVVICCDGTNGEFRLVNTNVVRLFELLDHDPLRQMTFYDPGLGTMGDTGAWTALSRALTRGLGLAFAYGLRERIGGAYRHLMEYYEPGDRIYLFGFSRGAYTVRALAGLVHLFGLLRKGSENLIPYVTDMFGQPATKVFKLAASFKPQFSRDCDIHFVGVWDTVSSVGWIYDPQSLPYTANNPIIKIGRHAVSIDERRTFFRQNLWGAPVDGQDLSQVWFAGVHSDVGGGYPEKESGLANITLMWMLDEARKAGLLIDEARLAAWQTQAQNRPDARGPLHRSLEGPWWILEWLPKRYWEADADPPAWRWKIPRGEPRDIKPTAVLHPSVLERMKAGIGYAPPQLRERSLTAP